MSATGLMSELEMDIQAIDLLNETVEALCSARLKNQKIAPESFQITSTSDAYQIQKSLLDMFSEMADTEQSGWKVALSGAGAQQKYGIQKPVYGFLTQSAAYVHHAKIQQQPKDELKLEVELVFSIKQELDPMQSYSDAELIQAIAEVCPALEIANVRWTHWDITLPQFIADNSAAGAYVLGEPIELDLKQLAVIPKQMIESVIESSNVDYMVSTNDIDQPLVNYLWLIRELLANNQSIRAGQIILSGSLIRPIAMNQGHYEFYIAGQRLSVTVT